MGRWRLQQLKQQVARVVNRPRASPVIGGYRGPRFDHPDFKRFLSEGPDFDALEIERARDTAPSVGL